MRVIINPIELSHAFRDSVYKGKVLQMTIYGLNRSHIQYVKLMRDLEKVNWIKERARGVFVVNVAKKEHKRAIKVESFYLNKSKEPFGAVYG